MARNDVYLNINALSPADAVVTGQQDMTAATVPELVLGDTPTFNFYFTDNTNVWPSWAGNASYSLTWALSDAVAGDFSPAATTGNVTPITGGWSVVLPLNSYDLVGLLNTKRVGQPYPVTNLWQQLRVTDPSGNEITRAMFWTPVRYRAISDTQNTESASPTGGRFVTVNNVNTLTTPTAAQFYSANPVPTSALGTASNGQLLIGNGTGFTKATLTAGTGVSITNGSGSITIDASGAQETLTATVKNAESVAITKGQVVYLFGATGGFASVKLAYNTSDATSAKTFGVVSSTSIAANGTGTVTCVGVVDGLNLGAYNDGDTLYLGATPGSVTATKPYAPNHLVYVGIVERANAGNGELYVRVQNGYELDEIHDVQINAPKLAGQTLIYDQTNDLWKNARLTGTANQITVTNADAAVTLSIPTNPTLPGNLTVSGTGTSTLAGNLTVSGTGLSSVAGALNVTGALLAHQTAALNMAHEGSSLSQLVSYGADSSTYGRLNVTLRKAGTGVGAVTALALTSTDATLSVNLTISGATRVSDGTAAAPSLSFSSDTTKGLYNYGANEVGLAIAGGASLRFATSGIIRGGSVGAQLQLNASTGAIDLTAAGTNQNVTLTPSGTGIVSINRGLAASATGTAFIVQTTDASSLSLFAELEGNATSASRYVTLNSYMGGGGGGRNLVLNRYGGNVLLGTTTDSGNGKLQLATHTTSAGGIGFGTDVSLYRSGADQLTSNSSGTANNFFLRHSTTAAGGFQVQIDSSKDVYLFQRENRPMYIGTNNTTALTLDSSQRVITASTLNVGSGTNDAQFINVFTNKVQNTSGPVTINLPADSSGVVTLYSAQSGIGKSMWQIPYINDGGTVQLGTAVKTIKTADPVSSAVAATGAITVSVLAANTYCYWGINCVKP